MKLKSTIKISECCKIISNMSVMLVPVVPARVAYLLNLPNFKKVTLSSNIHAVKHLIFTKAPTFGAIKTKPNN